MSATIKSLGSRRSDAERNTERIIQAAVSQLRLRPDATVASIARKAGLSRATVYGHFSSRHSLIDAAIARVLDENRDVLDDAAVDDGAASDLSAQRVLPTQAQALLIGTVLALLRRPETCPRRATR